MLSGNDIPFPDNPVCKLCLTRPCKRLFSGRVYPGKMIFVHHSEFLSLPCHTPNMRPQQEERGEEVALTDDIEVITGKLEITNPRWEPVSEAEEGGDSEIPLMGDKIRLLADIKNYPEGAPVSFDIYDSTEATPFLIETVRGSNKAGKASAEWVVADPQKRGDALKLTFEAGARSKYTPRIDVPWQKKGTWIEIVLTDEEEAPIPEEKYRITDSAGMVKEGTLDKDGSIRVEGLAPGTCEVVFPDFEEGAWNAIEPAPPATGLSSIEEPKIQENNHWIEIEFVDEEGAPIANANYIVTDSVGTEKKRTFDDGSIKIEGLAPGTCEIAFPDFDEGALTLKGSD
jgi:hypothetical protein